MTSKPSIKTTTTKTLVAEGPAKITVADLTAFLEGLPGTAEVEVTAFEGDSREPGLVEIEVTTE